MKRILFVGLIALLVLLAVPAAMAANVDFSGTVVQPAIEVSVDSGSAAFTQLITGSACNVVGGSGSGMPTLKAVVTGDGVTGWAVTASTPDVGYSVPQGRMYTSGGGHYLSNWFKLGSDHYDYTVLYNPISNFMTGTTTGEFTDGLYMKQCIDGTDADGTYFISVTFTGTVTGTS